MRLTKFQYRSIKNTFLEVFEKGEIYLFGSRVDDNKKGGDIDLYIKTDQNNLQRKKIKFLAKLKQQIGEQKIDVVFSKTPHQLIDKNALEHGILL